MASYIIEEEGSHHRLPLERRTQTVVTILIISHAD